MNKAELASKLSNKTKLSKKQSANCIDAICELIKDSVKRGENVSIKEFGSFELKYRAQKLGLNPRTGEPLTISARKVPAFRATQGFKKVVNE